MTSAALTPEIVAELERSLAALAWGLRPQAWTRIIISLAECQEPGAELRSLYLSIAAAALTAAAQIPKPKPLAERPPGRTPSASEGAGNTRAAAGRRRCIIPAGADAGSTDAAPVSHCHLTGD
jgi:hypothetical protein